MFTATAYAIGMSDDDFIEVLESKASNEKVDMVMVCMHEAANRLRSMEPYGYA